MELDLHRRRVTRSGKRIDLTAKEFALDSCCCAVTTKCCPVR